MGDAFTYEDIYELFRNEQYSSDLQTLTINDLKKIKKYFEEKNSETKNQDQSLNLFSTHNRAKIQVELSNATRIVKDLLERRERKVISRAVFNSRSDDSMRDTSNMLTLEEELYDKLIKFFKKRTLNIKAPYKIQGSQIQKKVWSELKKIRPGHTKTYGEIAKKFKLSPRHIGKICGQNKLLLAVPCHRVIRSDGSWGDFLLWVE